MAAGNECNYLTYLRQRTAAITYERNGVYASAISIGRPTDWPSGADSS